MKKRFLSAALALAMVLTLLPLSIMTAFATPAEGADAYYHVIGNNFTNVAEGYSGAAGDPTGWYLREPVLNEAGKATGKYNYTMLGSGIVASVATNNGATAKWYSAPGEITVNDKPTTVKPAQFTLLGTGNTVAIGTLDWDITNAKLNGNNLTIGAFSDRNQKIIVNGNGLESGSTLTLTNGTLAGRTLNLTVNYAAVNGNITVTDKTENNKTTAGSGTVSLTGCTVGSISMPGGTVTLSYCTVSGAISMAKGTLTLNGTTGATSIAMGTSAYGQGGTVNLNEGSSTGSTAMYGPSTLNIRDTSNAGGVTVFGGSKADVPANASKADETQKASPNWKGVTVNLSQSGTATSINEGSSNSGIGAASDGTDLTTHTIKAESRSNAGAITLNYANVTLDGAGATSANVGAGSVKLSGSATIGDITVGGRGKCTLEVGAGATVTGAVVSTAAAADLTVKISGGLFSSATPINLGDYAGGGITGGTFGAAVPNASWLSNVTYQIERSGSFTYTNSFADAVSAYTDSSSNKISIVGSKAPVEIAFVLDDNAEPAFKLGADVNTLVTLPTVIGKRSVSKWYDGNIPLTAGEYYPVNGAVTLKATSTEADLGTINGVTAKVTGAASPNLTAELVGNTIKLSGAVYMGSNNYAPIELVFTTTTSTAADVTKLTVTATYYDTNPKTVRFVQPSGTTSLEVSNDYKEIGLKGSNTKFTVDCSGLTRQQSVVEEGAAATQVVTVSGTNLGNTEKATLINALAGIKFDYTGSPALQQAVNKALAGYTASGVSSAINTGRQAYARATYGNTNTATMNLPDVQAYDTLKLQVYLDIQVTNVTNYGQTNGSITLNITPKYHEMVYSGGTPAPNPVSKPLDSALVKSAGGVVIELPSSWGMTIFQGTPQLWAHHGDYVYKVAADNKFTDLHGFSTFVINTAGPVATVKHSKAPGTPEFYYDNLTTAVAEVSNGGVVTVAAGYRSSAPIPVNGSARQFEVDNSANAGSALTFTGANVVSDGKNDVYTVELTRDTVAGTTKITMGTSDNGSASLSATSAAPGATVSGTIKPDTGYKAGAFTASAQTSAGGSVNVTVDVDVEKNSFSFVVPNDAVSVVVTPAFVVVDNKVSFTSSANAQGTAQAITGTEDGKVEQGSTVSVMTIPKSGYRTIGLTARGNNGANATVTRTGLNSFSVVVPVGAAIVTLTPSFDADTSTPFTDVLSTHWASKYVTWTYQTKYFEGTGTYTFAPADYITRGEVVAALWKAENKPVVNYANPFKDVPTNYWAYDAVMWAASKGLIDTSTGYFSPTGYASRAEVVAILYKRAGSPTVYGTSGFADVTANVSYANAVTWARQNKLTNGYGGSTYFRPNWAVSRAEVATFLARAFGKLA